MDNVRFGSKADIGASPHHVRFTPKSGHWNSDAKCPLRAKSRHGLRCSENAIIQSLCRPDLAPTAHGDAERLRGLEVDEQLDFACLLDRQVGGFLALGNAADIPAREAIGIIASPAPLEGNSVSFWQSCRRNMPTLP
jgi:hypothetical protein